jgi:Ca-activated chloride channel family protein
MLDGLFRFESPWLLLAAPFALAAAWWMGRRRARGDARLLLPDSVSRLALAGGFWLRVQRALPVVRAVVLLLLVVAVARPQSGSRLETLSTEGVDIVVALDNSLSMQAEDFKPKNRLEVAKQTVADFVAGRPNDRIGLVVFAGLAATRCPLTIDHEMFLQFLEPVDFTFPDDARTAIGMGLATAVNRLRSSKAKSKVVVLVTDGRNNAGQLEPSAAAEAAAALGIKVYTVGIGTEGLAPFPQDTPFGRRYVQQPADLDEDLLTEIAEKTEGRYFRATDPEALREVFGTIDELETTETETRVRVLYTDLFHLALLPALLLLLLERVLANTRLRTIP